MYNSSRKWLELLNQYWGYTEFRSVQEAVLQSILTAKKDTLVIIPTGGGKSVCYQLPALVGKGLCLVISPLIALMKDQVMQLSKKGITAAAIYGELTHEDIQCIVEKAQKGIIKILYLAPERIALASFLEKLSTLPICLIAIDEAHCISEWGFDFRPDYNRIAILREYFPSIPCIALTASATEEVQKDICKKILRDNKAILIGDFRRKNLSYSVFQENNKVNKITGIIEKVSGSTIVYCRTREQTESLNRILLEKSFNSSYYHAGLTHEERDKRQTLWTQNKIKIMVCTNAFGMGIDKADVRLVIHQSPPETLEHYYQEAGRAGRDGKKSYAVLLYEQKDLALLIKQNKDKTPSLKTLQTIYNALYDFLHIDIDTGAGFSFLFDKPYFIRRYALTESSTNAALHILEKHKIITLTPAKQPALKIQFIAKREYLVAIAGQFPHLEKNIEYFLRNYPGIYNHYTKIYPEFCARKLNKLLPVFYEQLAFLQHIGVLRYKTTEQNTATLTVNENRLHNIADILSPKHIKKLEKTHTKRWENMLFYTTQDSICRSHIIDKYFVPTEKYACGICDICTRKRNK